MAHQQHLIEDDRDVYRSIGYEAVQHQAESHVPSNSSASATKQLWSDLEPSIPNATQSKIKSLDFNLQELTLHSDLEITSDHVFNLQDAPSLFEQQSLLVYSFSPFQLVNLIHEFCESYHAQSFFKPKSNKIRVLFLDSSNSPVSVKISLFKPQPQITEQFRNKGVNNSVDIKSDSPIFLEFQRRRGCCVSFCKFYAALVSFLTKQGGSVLLWSEFCGPSCIPVSPAAQSFNLQPNDAQHVLSLAQNSHYEIKMEGLQLLASLASQPQNLQQQQNQVIQILQKELKSNDPLTACVASNALKNLATNCSKFASQIATSTDLTSSTSNSSTSSSTSVASVTTPSLSKRLTEQNLQALRLQVQ